jgi:hypothetical protein
VPPITFGNPSVLRQLRWLPSQVRQVHAWICHARHGLGEPRQCEALDHVLGAVFVYNAALAHVSAERVVDVLADPCGS